MEETKIDINYNNMFLAGILGFTLTFILLISPPEKTILEKISLFILMFCSFLIIRRLMSDNQLFILNKEVLTDYSISSKGITYKWEDITKIEEGLQFIPIPSNSIDIYLINDDDYIEKANFLLKIDFKVYSYFNKTPFRISTFQVEDKEEAIKLIKKYYKFYNQKN